MAGQKGPQEAPTNCSGWLYYDFGIMIVIDIGAICGDNGIGSWAGYVSGTCWSWGGLWDSRNSSGQPEKRLGSGNREGERVRGRGVGRCFTSVIIVISWSWKVERGHQRKSCRGHRQRQRQRSSKSL